MSEPVRAFARQTKPAPTRLSPPLPASALASPSPSPSLLECITATAAPGAQPLRERSGLIPYCEVTESLRAHRKPVKVAQDQSGHSLGEHWATWWRSFRCTM
jgi:hypothetical protein